jgi:hypothetical protein
VGVHIRTGYRWCWWLRNAALSYELDRKFNTFAKTGDEVGRLHPV